MRRRLSLLPVLLPVAAVLSLVFVQAGCTQELGWSAIEQMIASNYPGTPSITTDSLAARLGTRSSPQPVLLDVRTAEEFAVSHLQGARRVPPDAEGDALAARLGLDALPRDTPVVAYCSVGYRSAAVVQRLRTAGFTNAVNLEGSIFRWANEGRPVYRADTTVRAVHPYGSPWGRLLDDDLHAWGDE